MTAGYYDGADRSQRIMRERIQARWADAYSPARHIDPVLIAAALLLTAVGVVVVYSATHARLELQNAPTNTYAIRQLINWAVGIVGMVAVAALDYRHARTYAAPLYVGVLVLLGLVLTPLGDAEGGAQRWIDLGGFQLQPSELAKVAVIVAIAALLHESKGEPRFLHVAAALLLVGIPSGLIVLQPDLGTTLVFPWIVFVVLLIAGVKVRYLVGLAGAGAAAAVGVVRLGLLEEYQLARLTAFLDPTNAEFAQTSAYNTAQSMIAVGSGGFSGKGFLEGTQTNLAYVPENHTDFIFTVVGEEFGFVGAAVVLVLFAILLWRGLRIAAMAKDTFGTLIASGAVAMLVIQLFINVGMTIGIAPVTGIPLPFVSYGGTSLLSGYLLVGLLLNIHMRRF